MISVGRDFYCIFIQKSLGKMRVFVKQLRNNLTILRHLLGGVGNNNRMSDA